MRKLKLLLLFCLIPLLTYAQVKVSQLPQTVTLSGGELVVIDQNLITSTTTSLAISQIAAPYGPGVITGSIGGSALSAGTCTSGTVGVTGATTGMVATAQPNTYPGDAIVWKAYVSAAAVVTVKVCATVGATPVAATYSVRVIQ